MPTPNHSLLLVIDVQGRLADLVWRADIIQNNIRILLEGMNVLDVPVVATEQYPKGLGPTVPPIAALLGDAAPIEKNTFSCCGEFAFETKLVELHKTEIIVCGIETHVCVYQTVRDLIGLGYTVHLVTDAVSSRTEENWKLGVEVCTALGAKRTSTEMLLFEMLERAGTDQFKAISKLVK
ncbi:MAG: hydrolase [Bacteroidota bacterium]|jgi:nicotinamidase-related amidase|nr:hydrolase [Bacteroidota bacterium]